MMYVINIDSTVILVIIGYNYIIYKLIYNCYNLPAFALLI